MTYHWTSIVLFTGLAALAAGCHSKGPEAPRPVHTALPPAQSQVWDTSADQKKPSSIQPTSGSIHIDERIVAACGNLPEPHFAFDSAAITGDAADQLRLVADCFTSGALKGKTVKLVGRADPRGTPDYNLVLGQNRAQSVQNFLTSVGIQGAKITTMSRGAFDATGTDEESWARDRRVDIVLGD